MLKLLFKIDLKTTFLHTIYCGGLLLFYRVSKVGFGLQKQNSMHFVD